MKPVVTLLLLFSITLSAPSMAWAGMSARNSTENFEVESGAAFPVCGLLVGKAFKSEVEVDPHQPDWKDIEADQTGVKIGLKQLSRADFSRSSCYQSCSAVYR